jgi:hypothetical protein
MFGKNRQNTAVVANDLIKKLQRYSVDKPKMERINYRGINKRALAIIPGPVLRETQEIPITDQSKLRQLFLSLEANQSTCCLRISSSHHRSRSAILVFRGRVLGCIYGRKHFKQQLFGKQAFTHILADMSDRHNGVDAYMLSEELVIAAASLFHGEVFNGRPGAGGEEVFESAYNYMTYTGMPGCIVISGEQNASVATVYVTAGKIVGVYSQKDGWVSTRYETAAKYVTKATKVTASMISVGSMEELNALSFSLSGLTDGKSKVNPSYMVSAARAS